MSNTTTSSSSILQFQMPSTKTVISTAASVAATTMVLRSVIREHLPKEIRHFLYQKLQRILASFSNQFTIVIEDLDSDLVPNHLFHAAQLYLQPTAAAAAASGTCRRFRVTLPNKETTGISLVMERNSEMQDSFDGVNLKWRLLITKRIRPRFISRNDDDCNPTRVSEIRRHELSFHKKHREMVLTKYLPYVVETSMEMKQLKKATKLFTLRMDGRRVGRGGGNPWQSVSLDHPANFDTVAMDVGAKEAIIEDLDRFLKRKGMYRRVGKAWKRGYLLYGPPGTGKSSLVAAMANYLNFDIYDLELGGVRRNSDLRKVLISTTNRSILVVEDIDCSDVVPDRRPRITRSYVKKNGVVVEEKKVSLSGLLNFVDGLWSSIGEERIIVFTTNHKEKLDPALLRPGRMDVHIHMSYCTPGGFHVLATNYLGTLSHPLFPKVKELIGMSRVTPAEVGEQLLKHADPEQAITALIHFLQVRKQETTVITD